MSASKFIQSCIQGWLNLTGRKVDFTRYPVLKGPIAGDEEIGEEFYHKLAERENLKIKYTTEGGLLLNFHEVIDQIRPFSDKLDPEIPKFYEQTSHYNMEVWSKWSPPISWIAKLLIRLVSVEMKQLNIPLDSLETSYGMDSSVIHLLNGDGDIEYACWLRKSIKSNKVVYAGFYSSFQLGDSPFKHVKVVFPLPKGNVTVILKVEVLEDGSIQLMSLGKRFGQSGYYRLHKNRHGVVKARMIPIKETIHVFQDQYNVLRTDHYFRWRKMKFLQLHYKIIPK
ncbi:MAG: hypothetical protein IIA45_12215 [Bacteroidetes bacterium]|nr:hypothetical protein [Bacteroidota bacterium]